MDLLDVTNFALDRILSPRTAVSSAIPDGAAATGRHSQDETSQRTLPSPCADTGTAGVSDLPGSDRARVYALERVIDRAYDLARAERYDELHDVVRAEYLAIHGKG